MPVPGSLRSTCPVRAGAESASDANRARPAAKTMRPNGLPRAQPARAGPQLSVPPSALSPALASTMPATLESALASSGVSHSTPNGGTVITAEAGLPCQGSATASMPPMLPTPLPP